MVIIIIITASRIMGGAFSMIAPKEGIIAFILRVPRILNQACGCRAETQTSPVSWLFIEQRFDK